MKDKLTKTNKKTGTILLKKATRFSLLCATLSFFVYLPVNAMLDQKREELGVSYHQLAEQVSEQKEASLFGNLKKQLESIGLYFQK